MTTAQILVLAVIQGLAELLPVSSSAHVIFAERLMGLDPGAPEMTFLLVMLHTGTMFAVLFYFRSRWKPLLFPHPHRVHHKATPPMKHRFIKMVVLATACTGVLGLALKKGIEKVILEGMMGIAHGEIEHLFRNLPLMACALFTVGLLILYAGRLEKLAKPEQHAELGHEHDVAHALNARRSIWIGVVQGICLPFRGFSRSGATISTGLILGIPRHLAEEFSFALAVVLTPPVIVLELHRLVQAKTFNLAADGAHVGASIGGMLLPGAIGMVFAFGAGLVALRWLSSWLENGRWKYFGYYCLGASVVVLTGHFAGI